MARNQRDAFLTRFQEVTIGWGEGGNREAYLKFSTIKDDKGGGEIEIDGDEDSFHLPWVRRQFPVRLAFAMTTHKSQGQTLGNVGVWLGEPMFTHGQLYVAASRVGHPDGIVFAVAPTIAGVERSTRNVVYPEILPAGDG